MPEALGPLLLPPTPPEARARTHEFSEPLRRWMLTMVEWLTHTIRVLKDTWAKLVAVLTSIIADVAEARADIAALQDRLRDLYTFVVVGTLATGTGVTQVVLVVRAAGVLKEAFAYVTAAPTGAALVIDIHRNGTTIFSGTKLQVAAGAQTGVQTGFASPAVAIGDVLTLDIDAVGSTNPGENLTAQVSVGL